MAKERRIGILGGTFNPVHRGHLHLAKHAARKLKLDKIILVPANIPPHKKIEGNASPKDRVAMIRRAIKGNKSFSLSLFEILKKKKSYSIATLRHFNKTFGPKAKLFFIIGADSVEGISKWKDIDNALRLAQFVVFSRSGYSQKKYPLGIEKVNMPKLNISSSEIRRLIKKGKSIKGLVSPTVHKYLRNKRLYMYGDR